MQCNDGGAKWQLILKKRKREIRSILDGIEQEAETLLKNIAKFRKDLEDVDEKTDFKEFDEAHDLERCLGRYIALYI